MWGQLSPHLPGGKSAKKAASLSNIYIFIIIVIILLEAR